MEISQGKTFTKPQPGVYTATIADVVEMPNIQTAYGIKHKIRVHWILATLQGQPIIDNEGNPIEAVAMWNANMSKNADLPKRLASILGQAPPVINTSEQIEQLIIGRSNFLVLEASANSAKPSDPYINVQSIAPLQPGMVAPVIPPNYIRRKNRAQTQAGPNGQPVQTYAVPQTQPGYPSAPGYGPTQQQPTQQPINLNAGAPAQANPNGKQPF
jgi:hypothetical protein